MTEEGSPFGALAAYSDSVCDSTPERDEDSRRKESSFSVGRALRFPSTTDIVATEEVVAEAMTSRMVSSQAPDEKRASVRKAAEERRSKFKVVSAVN